MRFKLPIWIVLLIGLGILYHNYFRSNAADAPPPEPDTQEVQITPTPVRVAPAFRGELLKYVHATGYTEPIRQARIISRVAGQIQQLPVHEGQWVRAGEVLAQIDDELLQIELAEARSNLLKAQVEYALWKKQWDASRNDSTSPARLRELETQYRQAQSRYQRGELNELQFMEVERRYRIAQILSGQLREEVIAEQSGLKAAEMRYARALYNVRNSKIVAPFTGLVSNIQVSEGTQVQQNQQLMTVVDLQQVKIKLQVLESQLQQIRTGEALEVRFAAFPDTVFNGKIIGIDPAIDLQQHTFTVVAIIPNPEGLIKAGMFGEARLVVARYPNRLLVPRDAVVVRDQRKLVFIVREQKAIWCYIRTGEENEDFVEVTDSDFNLKPGEPVIVDGQFALAHNAPVHIISQNEAQKLPSNNSKPSSQKH